MEIKGIHQVQTIHNKLTVKDFFLSNYHLFTYSFEVLAAVSGSYYLKKVKDNRLKIFVSYLWLTAIVEFLALYTFLLPTSSDSEWLQSLKNSGFSNNTWLYNIYSFLAIGLIGIFYASLINRRRTRNVILTIFLMYSAFTVLYFLLTDTFFKMSIPYSLLIGTCIICIYVVLYFLELIKSDEILKFYKLPTFYISVGLLLWYVSVSPLFIFNAYFNSISTEFGEFRALLLLFINICTYSCFAFGFLYPLRKTKI